MTAVVLNMTKFYFRSSRFFPFVPVCSCFFPFLPVSSRIFPILFISSSFFFKYNSRSSALIALALFVTMVKHKKIYVRSILASCGMMFRVALTVSLPGVMFRSAPLFTRLELPSPTPSPALPWLLTLHFPKLPIYPDESLHGITITQLCPFNL